MHDRNLRLAAILRRIRGNRHHHRLMLALAHRQNRPILRIDHRRIAADPLGKSIFMLPWPVVAPG
jgi:hypothetical protein